MYSACDGDSVLIEKLHPIAPCDGRRSLPGPNLSKSKYMRKPRAQAIMSQDQATNQYALQLINHHIPQGGGGGGGGWFGRDTLQLTLTMTCNIIPAQRWIQESPTFFLGTRSNLH